MDTMKLKHAYANNKEMATGRGLSTDSGVHEKNIYDDNSGRIKTT